MVSGVVVIVVRGTVVVESGGEASVAVLPAVVGNAGPSPCEFWNDATSSRHKSRTPWLVALGPFIFRKNNCLQAHYEKF